MTRETKIGLVVTSSFLCLVGMVVAGKMRDKAAQQQQPAVEEEVKIDDPVPESTEGSGGLPRDRKGSSQQLVADGRKEFGDPPPPAPAPTESNTIRMPGDGAHEQEQPHVTLPPGSGAYPGSGDHEVATHGDHEGNTRITLPTEGSNPPRFDVHTDANKGSGSEALTMPDENDKGSASGRHEHHNSAGSAIDPPPANPDPQVVVPPPSDPTAPEHHGGNGSGSGALVMPLPPASSGSGSGEIRFTPVGNGGLGLPPGDKTNTQPRDGSDGSGSQDTHEKIQPLPIPSTADPVRDPGHTPVVPVQHTPVNPTPGSGSPPVEIPINVQPPPAYKPSQVKVYDEVRHLCAPTDSMQTISQYYYKDARYADALLAHNRNHALANSALKSDPPVLRGAYIYVPDLWVLQEKYPQLISGQTGASVPPGR